MLFLQVLVLHTALVLADTLQDGDALLLGQDPGVYRRVRQEDDDGDTDKDSEGTEEDVDDLVGGKDVAVGEGDAVCDESTEDLRETYLVMSARLAGVGLDTVPFCRKVSSGQQRL